MNFNYMLEILPKILAYVPYTLILAATSMVFAIILGLVVAFLRRSPIKIVQWFTAFYISIFRGIPTVVQLFIIYFGLPQIFPSLSSLDAMYAAIIGFSFKESSYLAEIFRAGLDSVDKGQFEASLAVGMKRWKIYQSIILPQAIVNAVPATGNVFVSLIKETSIAFTLGITELFAEGKLLAASSMLFLETYIVVGFVYWAIVVIVSVLQVQLEKRISVPYKR